jgi:hypothetical protein
LGLGIAQYYARDGTALDIAVPECYCASACFLKISPKTDCVVCARVMTQ